MMTDNDSMIKLWNPQLWVTIKAKHIAEFKAQLHILIQVLGSSYFCWTLLRQHKKDRKKI